MSHEKTTFTVIVFDNSNPETSTSECLTLQLDHIVLTTWKHNIPLGIYSLNLEEVSCRQWQWHSCPWLQLLYVPIYIYIDFMWKTQNLMWDVASFFIFIISGLCATFDAQNPLWQSRLQYCLQSIRPFLNQLCLALKVKLSFWNFQQKIILLHWKIYNRIFLSFNGHSKSPVSSRMDNCFWPLPVIKAILKVLCWFGQSNQG
jgi:hypothetical protein